MHARSDDATRDGRTRVDRVDRAAARRSRMNERRTKDWK
jgi:hypothetical protein